jgi:catechol 2,3-dioxygenase-like lactoylglutathione lyase family enzyme
LPICTANGGSAERFAVLVFGVDAGHPSVMPVAASYPLITVARLAESRDFFVTGFGMQPVFEASWVVMLSHRDDASISLGLMTSDHPSSPPGPDLFQGAGMILTMQVDDAAAMHAHFVALGSPITYPLTDAPWGQRRFMVRDPSGVAVDVVEQIEPAPGFWDRYLK